MSNETQLLARLVERWQGACADKSGSELYTVKDGNFVFTVAPSNAALCESLVHLSGVPTHAKQTGLTWTWPSVADSIFGTTGKLAKLIPGYEARLPQLHMARMIQRAKEMGQHAVIEGSTGTGKSYAYLYTAMEMGLRVVVSTSNKALQGQLVGKDVPTVLKSYPDKTACLVQGKSNYMCHDKIIQDGNVQLTGELAQWYATTQTGNTEEIDFAVDYKELSDSTADDGCTGRHCSHYANCFYYQAKADRTEADILICNHAILALHLGNPDAQILPGEFDLIIVDEAHKLIDYIRSTKASELKLSRINHYIDIAKRANLNTIKIMQTADRFVATIKEMAAQANPLTVHRDSAYESGIDLANLFIDAADIIFPTGDVPLTGEAKTEWRKAKDMRRFVGKLMGVSTKTQDGFVRWVESDRQDGAITITESPWDVARIMRDILNPPDVSSLSRSYCAKCNGDLGDSIAVLAGRAYCMACIEEADTMGDAEFMGWEEYGKLPPPIARRSATPFIFTSATLATPDMSGFMASMGIAQALQLVAPSPFDYKKNTVLYVPNGSTPLPNDKAFPEYLVSEMKRLALGSRGGVFLLFTSYASMKNVLSIRSSLVDAGLQVLVQGEQTKLQISNAFKANGNCVLFGTKSFWEGIDIQGDNLRMIVIDKLPFPAPHPLTEAIKSAGAGNWNTVDLPLAITDLKQGTGRLIRTQTDRGVLAVLDVRIRTSQYGRDRILPSLPPSPLVHDSYLALDFLQQNFPDKPTEVSTTEAALFNGLSAQPKARRTKSKDLWG